MSDSAKALEKLARIGEIPNLENSLAAALLRARKALREVSEQSIPEAPRAKARAFEIVRSTMDRVDAALADTELEESLL